MADRKTHNGLNTGDAASLWNFTPSPGWTEEEARTLKLCVMRHGVGAWGQIAATGLLPGKTTGQLSSQTQRLLGQQSLAAFTGLRVDVDRVRRDNEARADAQRKAGLVIRRGPNPTREMRAAWQQEARERYGLSDADVANVEQQLAELAAAKGICLVGAAGAPAAGGSAAATSEVAAEAACGAGGGAGAAEGVEPEPVAEPLPGGLDIMECPVDPLTRPQQLELVRCLHTKLAGLVRRLSARAPELCAAAGVPLLPQLADEILQAGGGLPRGVTHFAGPAPAAAAADVAGAARSGLAERSSSGTIGAEAVPTPVPLGAAAAQNGQAAGSGIVGAKGGAKRSKGRSAQPSGSGMAGGVRKGPERPHRRAGPAAGARALTVASAARGKAWEAMVAADLAELSEMGFEASKAREALEETGYCGANAAANWLAVHCL